MAIAQEVQGGLDYLEAADGDQGVQVRRTEDHQAGVRQVGISQGDTVQVKVHQEDRQEDLEVNPMTKLGAQTGVGSVRRPSTEEECRWAGTTMIWRRLPKEWHRTRERVRIGK